MIKWKETVITSGNEDFIHPNNPTLGSKVSIKLKVYKENPIESVILRTSPNGEQINIIMDKSDSDEFYQSFVSTITITTLLTIYRFAIITKDDFYWFNAKQKLTRTTPSDIYDFKIIANIGNTEWIKKSVFYQIFPDRFCDGDPTNNVKTGEYTWHGQTSRAREWDDSVLDTKDYKSLDFYGGDLAGIKNKIPYFKEFGINSLYLNPIFQAPSNHKYDIVDYKKIDPHFGSNDEFASLVEELHENGIRIILDGVFNHTGEGHKWFNKLGIFEKDDGAFNRRDSPYHDFYTFYDWPENYEAWFGYKSLPKLNYNSEKLRSEVYKNENSVLKYWLGDPYNVDGWRFDVANMIARQDETQLHSEIWEEVRKEVKDFKSSAYIIGESFYDGTPLLDGKKLDGIMNYQGFNFPLLKWLTKKELTYIRTPLGIKRKWGKTNFTVKDFKKQLNRFRILIPFQLQLLNFNLLSSHDIPRFYTRISEHKEQYKLAIIFLLTYIGVPSIYYGDEIGMKGSFDPDNRKPMIWDEKKWDNNLREFYKSLVNLRRNRIELQEGLYRELFAKHEIFAFARIEANKFSLIILNNNKERINFSLPVWKIGLMNEKIINYFDNNEYTINNGFVDFELDNYECLVLSNAKR